MGGGEGGGGRGKMGSREAGIIMQISWKSPPGSSTPSSPPLPPLNPTQLEQPKELVPTALSLLPKHLPTQYMYVYMPKFNANVDCFRKHVPLFVCFSKRNTVCTIF